MKILFVAKGDLPDYQSDMVFHGCRSLFGADCVDANYMWYMYREDRQKYWNERVPDNGRSYGRGMTIHGKLPTLEVDRTEILEKIRSKYFDCVIYGSVNRCQDYLQDVLKVYNRGKIIFIDGEDNQNINYQLIDLGGHLFKRELTINPTSRLHPINFCVPEELVLSSVPVKTKDEATIIPGKLDTYIFNDEASYYEDYQKSMVAMTIKKGGWDCNRHQEILMNGCMPYFPGLQECPEFTMMAFPKERILKSNDVLVAGTIDTNWYNEEIQWLLDYTKNNLTTKSIANKVLEKI